VIHRGWEGKIFLRILFRLEEWFLIIFGEKGSTHDYHRKEDK
jgi:hypothetical protein